MTTYYVGIGGNDGNSGLTWALRKLTLNGAEDVPVVAGDTVYVGPGVYREMLTMDVSGGAGNPITYIGDVTGENTDDVGGIVRITGSDDDRSATRASCITNGGVARNYRTFRGFMMDMVTSGPIISMKNEDSHLTVEDCYILSGASDNAIAIYGTGGNHTVERCFFRTWYSLSSVFIQHSVTVNDANILVQNCIFLHGGTGVRSARVGGITVRNCLAMFQTQSTGGLAGIQAALAVGQTIDVSNSIIQNSRNGIHATVATEVIEDYNTFWQNVTDRTNVNVGLHSKTYPALFQPMILHSGEDQASGYKFPWWFGELSEWSQVRAIAGSNPAAVDLFGIERPFPNNRRSWGPIQHMDTERETGTVHAGSSSIAFHRPARKQFFVPCTATSTTVSVWVYREAGYLSDRNPGMILKQPGASDRVTRDAGLAAQWNQISDTFTPNADPPWFVVELANESYYSTSTSTTSSSTSTTVTLPTQSTSTSTTVSTSTSTTLPTLSTSTSTTSISTSTTTLDVFFDDLVVS